MPTRSVSPPRDGHGSGATEENLCGVLVVTVASHLGLAYLADGFWTGMLFRIAAGVGWAGTYMVGLRALTDELSGDTASRAVGLHAAGIGLSGAASFVVAGFVGSEFGWQAAFMVASVSAQSR